MTIGNNYVLKFVKNTETEISKWLYKLSIWQRIPKWLYKCPYNLRKTFFAFVETGLANPYWLIETIKYVNLCFLKSLHFFGVKSLQTFFQKKNKAFSVVLWSCYILKDCISRQNGNLYLIVNYYKHSTSTCSAELP